MTRPIKILSIAFLSLALLACGGGGSSSGDGLLGDTENPNPEAPPVTSTPEVASISLSWTQPVARKNGDPLPNNEISTYEIYYYQENDAQGASEILTITQPKDESSTTLNLSAGTYFFAMATVDTQGNYSDNSDYVVVVIE